MTSELLNTELVEYARALAKSFTEGVPLSEVAVYYEQLLDGD
jgi:hypothetical protein